MAENLFLWRSGLCGLYLFIWLVGLDWVDLGCIELNWVELDELEIQ